MSVDTQSVYSSRSHSSHGFLNPDPEKGKIVDPLNTQVLTSNNRFQLSQSYLTGIQTVRCLAVIGFVGSLIASVLVPAVIFGAVALTACILKNRVKEKDLQALETTIQNGKRVTKPTVSRSQSNASRISTEPNASQTSGSSQQSGKSSWLPFFSKERRESISSEAVVDTTEEKKGVNEIFFSCIDHQKMHLQPQYFDLLKLCYFSLLLGLSEDPASMPEILGKTKASKYLERKLDRYAKKPGYPDELSNVEITIKPDKKNEYAMKTSLEEQNNLLKTLQASDKFELIANIYDKLVDEENRKGATSDAKHFKENADHARLYARVCCAHKQSLI